MPPFGPIDRRRLIRVLRDAGFAGPFPGGNHHYMLRGDVRVPIPNPHRGDVSRSLLALILKQAEISRREWEQL